MMLGNKDESARSDQRIPNVIAAIRAAVDAYLHGSATVRATADAIVATIEHNRRELGFLLDDFNSLENVLAGSFETDLDGRYGSFREFDEHMADLRTRLLGPDSSS